MARARRRATGAPPSRTRPAAAPAPARPLPRETGVAVLGAGLAGLSTAHHVGGGDALVIEREARVGGLTKTEARGEFLFDHTGHWLHLRDAEMRRWAEGLLAGRFIEVERKARIYSHGRFTRYPYQSHAYGLPPEVAKECVLGFVDAWTRRQAAAAAGTPLPEPENFDEWCRFHYGEGISRHFMVPYNCKLWGVPPTEITAAWCDRFVPKPNLAEVVGGAVGANEAEVGYNVRFLYPADGGIEELPRAIARTLPEESVHTARAPSAIDWRRRVLRFGGGGEGEALRYDRLVSSIPLPALVDLCEDVPDGVRAARARLRATSICYLNVGIKFRQEQDFHWLYVPEERLPFYRVGVFSNAAPHMAPKGRGSLYVELAPRGAFDRADVLRRVIDGLVEIGLIRRAADVLFADFREIPVAYVIFDHHYFEATATIQGFLKEAGIDSIGRFGRWTYNGMEDALLDGRDAARRWREGGAPRGIPAPAARP
jgi:protoporphyrinogen oxidase